MNRLYFGDNLEVMREHLADESVDLVYLDPPFNSSRNYNVLFQSPKGHRSEAQITAFKDTWEWGRQAEDEFRELLKSPNTTLVEMLNTFRGFLKDSAMMAYLTMMASRLQELHRVLKPTGSLYLHCDPTASHYLKVVLDSLFGVENFRNEIIWKRQNAHNKIKRWGPVHDVLLFYSKGRDFTWNQTYEEYDQEYLRKNFRYEDEHGIYTHSDLTGSGVRKGESGQPWRGFNPTTAKRHWAIPRSAVGNLVSDEEFAKLTSVQKLDLLDANGRIHSPVRGIVPRLKRYFEPLRGTPIQDVITDTPPIGAQATERLGYPTQKPLALLERIVAASSNPGDLVLDPFCGCGTAVHAAEKLGRSWVGIDITHLAVSLIEKRMRDAFPDITFQVHGTPKDIEAARNLAARDKYQFQWWACSLVNARPHQGKKKGADGGIDGLIFFEDGRDKAGKIIISVKGGDNVGVSAVRDLHSVVEREKADIGMLVTLTPPTKPMEKEAVAAGYYHCESLNRDYPRIQILTVEGLLGAKERADFPDWSKGGLHFKRAKREQRLADTGQQTAMFADGSSPDEG